MNEQGPGSDATRAKILARKGAARAYYGIPVSPSFPKFTFLSSVSGAGRKLAPLFIFRYTYEVRWPYQEIVEHVHATHNLPPEDLPTPLFVVASQPKAWNDTGVYTRKYLARVLKPYQKKYCPPPAELPEWAKVPHLAENGNRNLRASTETLGLKEHRPSAKAQGSLFLSPFPTMGVVHDRAPAHFSQETCAQFGSEGIWTTQLAAGSTKWAQWNDVYCHAPLRSNVAVELDKFYAKRTVDSPKLGRKDWEVLILKALLTAWYDPKFLPPPVVRRELLKLGTVRKLDNSEDEEVDFQPLERVENKVDTSGLAEMTAQRRKTLIDEWVDVRTAAAASIQRQRAQPADKDASHPTMRVRIRAVHRAVVVPLSLDVNAVKPGDRCAVRCVDDDKVLHAVVVQIQEPCDDKEITVWWHGASGGDLRNKWSPQYIGSLKFPARGWVLLTLSAWNVNSSFLSR
jgi:hypothetical protein